MHEIILWELGKGGGGVRASKGNNVDFGHKIYWDKLGYTWLFSRTPPVITVIISFMHTPYRPTLTPNHKADSKP